MNSIKINTTSKRLAFAPSSNKKHNLSKDPKCSNIKQVPLGTLKRLIVVLTLSSRVKACTLTLNCHQPQYEVTLKSNGNLTGHDCTTLQSSESSVISQFNDTCPNIFNAIGNNGKIIQSIFGSNFNCATDSICDTFFHNLEPIDVYFITNSPTAVPISNPTKIPSADPSYNPTYTPSPGPTYTPTSGPTQPPSLVPTPVPTAAPTAAPTIVPTAVPTAAPTEEPTAVPTKEPTNRDSLSKINSAGAPPLAYTSIGFLAGFLVCYAYMNLNKNNNLQAKPEAIEKKDNSNITQILKTINKQDLREIIGAIYNDLNQNPLHNTNQLQELNHDLKSRIPVESDTNDIPSENLDDLIQTSETHDGTEI
tara:strand:+ start:361 stop:1452 length:1092 start_codon:yes stop_codon:yes gene_type:complete